MQPSYNGRYRDGRDPRGNRPNGSANFIRARAPHDGGSSGNWNPRQFHHGRGRPDGGMRPGMRRGQGDGWDGYRNGHRAYYGNRGGGLAGSSALTANELVDKFKKSGNFDALRRELMKTFRDMPDKAGFDTKLEAIISETLAYDPRLQARVKAGVGKSIPSLGRNEGHEQIMRELSRHTLLDRTVNTLERQFVVENGAFDRVREDIDGMLKTKRAAEREKAAARAPAQHASSSTIASTIPGGVFNHPSGNSFTSSPSPLRNSTLALHSPLANGSKRESSEDVAGDRSDDGMLVASRDTQWRFSSSMNPESEPDTNMSEDEDSDSSEEEEEEEDNSSEEEPVMISRKTTGQDGGDNGSEDGLMDQRDVTAKPSHLPIAQPPDDSSLPAPSNGLIMGSNGVPRPRIAIKLRMPPRPN